MEKTNENEQVYDNGFHPHEVHLKDNYKFYRNNIFFNFARILLTSITKFVYFFPKKLSWGFKVKGKKNLKGQKSYVLIGNHVHPSDSILIETALFPPRLHYITTIQSNMGFPLVSAYFRLGGAVPIPDDLKLLKKFNRETIDVLNKKGKIMVFPEAALIPYCDHIRPFMQGAFNFAVAAKSTIIPVCLTFHKPKGLYKLTRRKKPCIHLNILEPYHITELGSRKETTNKVAEDLYNIMSDFYNKNSDYFEKNE